MRKVKIKGFTTAEMLVTLMIFSLGLLPLIILFQNTHKQTAQSKNLIIAQSIGRTMISEIRSKGFDVLAEEIKTKKYKIIHKDRPVSGKCVIEDETSINYPEYYNRFKTTVRLEDSGERIVNGMTKPANKIRVELDIQWEEPNMRELSSGKKFYLAFGTVVVKYDT